MKRNNLIFWIVTILFSAMMLFSAIPEIMNVQGAKDIMNQLGFPTYINPLLGVLKVLGVIVLLTPGYPRLKEWAYAGFFFDLLGATYSGIAKGGFTAPMLGMLIFFVPWALSYYFYQKKGSLATRPPVVKPAM